MKILIPILIGLLVVGCGGGKDKQSTNTNQSNNTPEKLITDPIVEKAIRKRLKKPKGELTKADMEKVTRLGIEYKNLTDVPEGLGNLSQLTYLSLALNQLTNVEGLEKLKKLETLSLVQNNLTSVKGLVKLTQLKKLYLSNNQLADVTGLEKLT